MASNSGNGEDVHSNKYWDLTLSDKDMETIIVANDDLLQAKGARDFYYIRRFFTNKALNFNAMRSTLTSL